MNPRSLGARDDVVHLLRAADRTRDDAGPRRGSDRTDPGVLDVLRVLGLFDQEQPQIRQFERDHPPVDLGIGQLKTVAVEPQRPLSIRDGQGNNDGHRSHTGHPKGVRSDRPGVLKGSPSPFPLYIWSAADYAG